MEPHLKLLLDAMQETQHVINRNLENILEDHNDVFKDHNNRITNLEKWMWRITGATTVVAAATMTLIKLIWK